MWVSKRCLSCLFSNPVPVSQQAQPKSYYDLFAFADLDQSCKWTVKFYMLLDTNNIVAKFQPSHISIVEPADSKEYSFWKGPKPPRAAAEQQDEAVLEDADDTYDHSTDTETHGDDEDSIIQG